MNSDELTSQPDLKKHAGDSPPSNNLITDSNTGSLLSAQNFRVGSNDLPKSDVNGPKSSFIMPPAPTSITGLAAGTGINRLSELSALPPPPPSFKSYSVSTLSTLGQRTELRLTSLESKYLFKTNVSPPAYNSGILSTSLPSTSYTSGGVEATSSAPPGVNSSSQIHSPNRKELVESGPSAIATSTAATRVFSSAGLSAPSSAGMVGNSTGNITTTGAHFVLSPSKLAPIVTASSPQTYSVPPSAHQTGALTSLLQKEWHSEPTASSLAQTQVYSLTTSSVAQSQTLILTPPPNEHSQEHTTTPQLPEQTKTYTSTPSSVASQTLILTPPPNEHSQEHTTTPQLPEEAKTYTSTPSSTGQTQTNISISPAVAQTQEYSSTMHPLGKGQAYTPTPLLLAQTHLHTLTPQSLGQTQKNNSTPPSLEQSQTFMPAPPSNGNTYAHTLTPISQGKSQIPPALPSSISQSFSSGYSPYSLQATSMSSVPPTSLPYSINETTKSTAPAIGHLNRTQSHPSVSNIATLETPLTPPESRALSSSGNNAVGNQAPSVTANIYEVQLSPRDSTTSTASLLTTPVTFQSQQDAPSIQEPKSPSTSLPYSPQTSGMVVPSRPIHTTFSSPSIHAQAQTRNQLQSHRQQFTNYFDSDNAPMPSTASALTIDSTSQSGQIKKSPPLSNNLLEFSAGLAEIQSTLTQPNTSQLVMGQPSNTIPTDPVPSCANSPNQTVYSAPPIISPQYIPPPSSTVGHDTAFGNPASIQAVNATAFSSPHTVPLFSTSRPPLVTPPPTSFHTSSTTTTHVNQNDQRVFSTPARTPSPSSTTSPRTSGPPISSSPLMGATNRPPQTPFIGIPPLRSTSASRAPALDVTGLGCRSADSPVNPAFTAQLSPITLGYGGSPALANSEPRYSLTSPTQPLNRLSDPGFMSPQGPGFVSSGGIRNIPPLQLLSIGSPITPGTPQRLPPNQQLFTHNVPSHSATSSANNNGNSIISGPPKTEPNTYVPLPPPSMFIDQPIGSSASDRLGGTIDSARYAADDSAGKIDSESARPLTGRSAVGSYASPRKSSKSLGPTHPKKANSRIDPAQMPRPQALELEVKFYTRSGSGRKVPPLSNAGFEAIDNGNCSPRYLRLTTAAPAVSLSMQNTIGLPLGMVFTPFARPENGEKPLPLIDYQQLPPRCTRCRGYINSSVKWINDGNSWICNLCYMTNSTPAWYFSSLDGNGLRLDRDEHAELTLGSYEFLAGSDYCTRPLQEPIYIFAIDISAGAQVIEATSASIKAVRCILSSLPTHERTKVGIFTFDTKLQFYHYRESANDQVKLLVVDPDDPTPPLPLSQWLLPASTAEHRATVESFLQRIAGLISFPSADAENMPPPPAGYSSGYNAPYTPERRCCPTAAIKVAQLALRKCGGQVYLLTSSNPTCGYGKIPKSRETMNAYGTERELHLYGSIDALDDASENPEEKKLYAPYLDLASICLEQQISVNIILVNSSMDEFRDVSLYSHLTEETGGNFFYVTGPLQLDENVQRLINQLQSVVENTVASECVMKIRTNVGLKVIDFIGPGKYHTVDDELYSASMDTNSTYCCGLQHTTTYKDEDRVFIQLAVLYTDLQMRRIIRIHNIRTFTTALPGLAYKTSDLDCVLALITKRILQKSLRKPLLTTNDDNPRNQLIAQLIDMLSKYRLSCSAQSPKTQLILPEALKLMPLYSLCLLKHPSLLLNKTSKEATASASSTIRQTGQPLIVVRAHERAYEIRKLRAATVRDTVNFLYPRLYVLHAVADDDTIELAPAERAAEMDVHSIPRLVAVSSEYFDSDGLYLLNDMSVLWIYIGRTVPTSDILKWFGVDVGNINAKPKHLAFTGNEEAVRMKGVIDILRKIGLCKQEVRFVWGDEVGNPNFERLSIRLVEDSMRGEQSYVDYLCKLHSQIQAKL